MSRPRRPTALAPGIVCVLAGLLAASPPVAAQEAPPEPPRAAPAAPAAQEAPARSYLGVVLEDVDEEDVKRLGLPQQEGALISEVIDASPAAEAGIRPGDVVLSWNEEPVFSAAELTRLVRETPPGREVPVEVFRDGGRDALTVTPGVRSEVGFLEGHLPPEARERVRERMEQARVGWRDALERLEELGGRLGEWDEGVERSGLGVRVRTLTPQLADYFGLGDRSGVLVASVRDGSPADSAGLQAGDVLLSVSGENVSAPGDAARAVRGAGGPIEVRVLRRDEERTLTARLPEREER